SELQFAAEKKKRLEVLAGILIALVGLVVFIGLAAGAWWLRLKHVEIDGGTKCPKTGPCAVYVLLFDQTDPIIPKLADPDSCCRRPTGTSIAKTYGSPMGYWHRARRRRWRR